MIRIIVVSDPADCVWPEIVWAENSMRLVLRWRHVVFSQGAQGVSEMVIGRWENCCSRCPIKSMSDDKRFFVVWPYERTRCIRERQCEKGWGFQQIQQDENSLIISGGDLSAGGTMCSFLCRYSSEFTNFIISYLHSNVFILYPTKNWPE